MLALARSEGQSIIIDGNIEVKIVKWSRSSVRLAIQAPREVKVDRDEIWRRENPGKLSPLEVAEAERRERFAREGIPLPPAHSGHSAHSTPPASPAHSSHGVSGGEVHGGGALEGPLLALKATGGGKIFVRPSADAPPFVHVGSVVEEGTVMGTLETAEGETKTAQQVHAPAAGTVAKILVSHGQTVEPGQSLFLLKPR